MRGIGIPEIDSVLAPSAPAALGGLYLLAKRAPGFWAKKPHHWYPKYIKQNWETKRLKGVLAGGFCIDALHEYFRDGLPRDAEPEYYTAIDEHNASDMDKLYYGQPTALYLGHVQACAILLLNVGGQAGNHQFSVTNMMAPVILKKISKLERDLKERKL
jgi:hypothetical protein